MVMMVVVVVVLVAVVAMMAMVAIVVFVAVAIVTNTSYDWPAAAAMNVDMRVASRARLVLMVMGRTVFVVFAFDRNWISAWQAAWRTDVRWCRHLAATRGRRGASPHSSRRPAVVKPARKWIQEIESASSGARSRVEQRWEAACATRARRRKRRLNVGRSAGRTE